MKSYALKFFIKSVLDMLQGFTSTFLQGNCSCYENGESAGNSYRFKC
jgi:hypothetical protein